MFPRFPVQCPCVETSAPRVTRIMLLVAWRATVMTRSPRTHCVWITRVPWLTAAWPSLLPSARWWANARRWPCVCVSQQRCNMKDVYVEIKIKLDEFLYYFCCGTCGSHFCFSFVWWEDQQQQWQCLYKSFCFGVNICFFLLKNTGNPDVDVCKFLSPIGSNYDDTSKTVVVFFSCCKDVLPISYYTSHANNCDLDLLPSWCPWWYVPAWSPWAHPRGDPWTQGSARSTHLRLQVPHGILQEALRWGQDQGRKLGQKFIFVVIYHTFIIICQPFAIPALVFIICQTFTSHFQTFTIHF